MCECRFWMRLLLGVLTRSLKMILTVPVYNSEISPPKHRGLLVGFSGQLIGIGSMVVSR